MSNQNNRDIKERIIIAGVGVFTIFLVGVLPAPHFYFVGILGIAIIWILN